MTKVAAVQMCSSHDVNENLKTAAALIKKAAQNNAKLIVLPEMFALMGKNERDKLAIKENVGNGNIQDFLSAQAKENNIWIVAGTIPLTSDNENKVSASCLVFNEQGVCVSRYDKIHLFDVIISDNETYQESATITPGDKLSLIDTPFGKVGLSVCYDIRFPELFRKLFNMGAEIITVPAAFTIKTGQAHWEILLRARAIENFCYVIAAAQVGTHSNGRKTYGHSMIISPWGEILAENTQDDVGVIYAEIDLAKLYEIRKAIPVKEHQRL